MPINVKAVAASAGFVELGVAVNTSRLRGKGEREKGKKKPFNLFPKPDSELKMQNPSSIGVAVFYLTSENNSKSSWQLLLS